MELIFWLLVSLFCIGFGALIVKIIFKSINGQGDLGVNLKAVNCPRCGEKMPVVRTPKSIHQALNGGGTCANCGCEMDKWGKEISDNDKAEIIPKQIEESKIEPINYFDKKGKTPVERVFEDDK